MYLKDSKTVVIKIGSSLLINDKKIVREKWLKEFHEIIKKPTFETSTLDKKSVSDIKSKLLNYVS